MELKAYINDTIGKELREAAIKRFNYFRGALSSAVEEAVIQWLRRNENISKRLSILSEKAEEDRNIVAVFIFGSFVSKKTDYRDIDIAFMLKDNENESASLAPYEDFKEDPKFDISCFNSLALNVKKEVLESGVPLLIKDRNLLYSFMIDTIKKYADFKHLYELMMYGQIS